MAVNRDFPGLDKGLYDFNTENFTTDVLPSVLGELSDLEQLMRMRSTSHLSPAQVQKRDQVIDLIGLFLQTEALATTSPQSQTEGDVSSALFRFLMKWTVPGFAQTWGADFDPESSPEVLQHWAREHGLSQQETQLLLPPIGVIGEEIPTLPSVNHTFIGLEMESRNRIDPLDAADSEWSLEDGFGHSEMSWTLASFFLDEAGLSDHAVVSRPEYLTAGSYPADTQAIAPVGNAPGTPQLVAFLMPNQQGESIIALTFSRSL